MSNAIDRCSHGAWADCDKKGLPVVVLANNDDDYYTQLFRSRKEFDEWVARLYTVVDEVFPP